MYISWVTWYKKRFSKQEAKFAIFVETLKFFTALPLIGKWNHIFSTPFPICGRKLVNMTAIFIVEVHLANSGLFPAIIYWNNLKSNIINRIRLAEEKPVGYVKAKSLTNDYQNKSSKWSGRNGAQTDNPCCLLLENQICCIVFSSVTERSNKHA